MAFFSTLFGAQAQNLTAQSLVSRRSFLAGLGGLTALTVLGCGSPAAHRDGSLPPGGGDTDGGVDASPPTRFSVVDNYAQIPCHYPADLDFAINRMVGVATAGGSQAGDRNHLFHFNPDAMPPIDSSTELDFPDVAGRTLSHFTRKTGNRGIVTANDGLYEVTLGVSSATRFIPYPTGVTYGGGALYVGAKLFIAAANLNASFDNDPGQVLVYDLDGSNAIVSGSDRLIATSRLNPTGVALRGSDRLVVLNSGRYGDVSTGTLDQGSLDLIDTAAESVERTIELGALYAQVSGEIALAPDGKTAVIGTADGSGKVLFVDLDTGNIAAETISGTQFHSSVKIDPAYGIVYVTDFNSGRVTVLDLATRAVIRSIALAGGASGNVEAGPSEVYGGTLIQTLPYAAVQIVPA